MEISVDNPVKLSLFHVAIGCPIVMCKAEKLKKDVFEDLPLSSRQDVCLSLFHCLNWFRELVSADLAKNLVSSPPGPFPVCQ